MCCGLNLTAAKLSGIASDSNRFTTCCYTLPKNVTAAQLFVKGCSSANRDRTTRAAWIITAAIGRDQDCSSSAGRNVSRTFSQKGQRVPTNECVPQETAIHMGPDRSPPMMGLVRAEMPLRLTTQSWWLQRPVLAVSVPALPRGPLRLDRTSRSETVTAPSRVRNDNLPGTRCSNQDSARIIIRNHRAFAAGPPVTRRPRASAH